MGGFFVAFSREGAPVIPDRTLSAVRAALAERCPGEITEYRDDALHCLVGSPNGYLGTHGDFVVIADGWPTPAGTDALIPRLATGWADSRDALLSNMHGGFALCVLDRQRRELTLARDAFGTRPLYWYEAGNTVYAASECKVLAALGHPLSIDPQGLAEMLVGRWILGDRHVLAPMRQVPAASYVRADSRGEPRDAFRYWRLPFAPEPLRADSLTSFCAQTRAALGESIAEAAHGSRGLGVFLSGGVDSSVIAACAVETCETVTAFVGRLPDSDNTELHRAVEVAQHLNIECVVVDISIAQPVAAVRKVVRRLEHSPRHPNNLVLAQLYAAAATRVDVVLQGDGAEVLFGLSDSTKVMHFTAKHELAAAIPEPLRRVAASALRRIPDARALRLARVLDWTPLTFASLLERVEYLPRVRRALRNVVGSDAAQVLPLVHLSEHADQGDALQAYQASTHLISSLLRHEQLSAPLGVNSVAPLLSKGVVDVACRLPRELRYTDASKPVLRALCDQYLPPHVSRWPKRGFEVPWEAWLAPAFADLSPSPEVRAILPPGFLAAAMRENDAEALWLVLTLDMLFDLFQPQADVRHSNRSATL